MHAPVIGVNTPLVGAREKLTGRAQYAGDLQLPGMLHAKVLRSPYPHARIVRIDTTAAKALPGVHLVLTGEDSPAAPWGLHVKEHRVLAVGRVRFVGEEVAVVVADTEFIARDAIDLIAVEYEELPAITSMELAVRADAPVVHEGRSNLAKEIRIERGDVDAGFAQSVAIHETVYEVPSQYPGYLEPMATVAHTGPDGRLTVWTSTQSVFLARARMAEALNRPLSSVRVVQCATGGGFGGKIVEECNSLIAGLAASHLLRPVRLVNTRLEDFQGARMSVPERIRLKIGVDANGKILAKDVCIEAECGAYAGLSPEIMLVSAMRSDNMHRIQNVRSHASLYYTNNPPRGAFRGFGGQQMGFALNSHLAVLADMLGMDLVELHRRNAVQPGDTSVHGWKFGSAGYMACVEQVCEAFEWQALQARPKDLGVRRRGIGLGVAMHVSGNRTLGNWDGSTVHLRMSEDGYVSVQSGECDAGQGSATVLTQLCAHELTLPLSHVRVAAPDTDNSPFCLGSLASRVTINAGNAMVLAAAKLRASLLAAAAEKLQTAASDLVVQDGKIVSIKNAALALTFAETARFHIFRHGGEGISVHATYDPPTVMMDAEHRGNIAPGYSFAAQAVEVEVDTQTGQVRLLKTYVSDDCGKAINPLAVHGQSSGAAVQAIGWTLYEHLQFENGRLNNGNLADYNMPTADSVPYIHSGLIESMEPNGPHGAKGASETAIVPGAGAIANAVFDAVGVRITQLPITPEKVLAALQEKAKREGMQNA
jgi:CO/xanthine dehydrogenase Mo-binding subunit